MLIGEVIRAARLWQVWLRIGVQDVRMRFRRSVLGVGWIFLNLAILILAIGVIYSKLLRQPLNEFLPFLTIGLIAWGYLTSSIVEGGNAFVASEGYIKQIGLPTFVYVFRFFVTTTITMLISLPVYGIVAFIYSVHFRLGVLWGLGGIFLTAVVSFLMIAIFSHLNARFRDATHISSVILQVLFYLTPIVWPPKLLQESGLHWVMDLNPFYHLLEVVRHPFIHSEPATYLNYLVVILLIVGLSMTARLLTKWYNNRIAYLL